MPVMQAIRALPHENIAATKHNLRTKRPMVDTTEFTAILIALTSSDNGVRNAAEFAFNSLKTRPDALVADLQQVLCASFLPQHIRTLASVLLRRVLIRDDPGLWDSLTGKSQRTLRTALLERLQVERDGTVRRKIADIVGELAAAVLDEDGEGAWPELLPYVFGAVGGSDGQHRETALQLFVSLADHVASMLDADQARETMIITTLQRCLGDASGAGAVRLEAMRALAAILLACPQTSSQQKLEACLPHMQGALQAVLTSGDTLQSCETLETLIDLAEYCPSFFRPGLEQCVAGMARVAASAGVDNGVRHLALEFLVTIAESAAGMCRKMGKASRGRPATPSFVGLVVPVCFAMMLDVEEDASWALAEDDEEDALEVLNTDVGRDSLDRIAKALQGRAALPECFRCISARLDDTSGDWRHQRAGLLGLSQIVEVMVDMAHAQTQRALVVQKILPFLQHPHPRVRHAALEALGQMSTDHRPEVQQEHHQVIMPALLEAMMSHHNTSARVRSHASAALINFLDGCPPEVLPQYMPLVLERALEQLREGPRIVREQAMQAIASTAEAAGDAFAGYYDGIMPLLKQVLMGCEGVEYRTLQGKTLECISLVGQAVGKEKFGVDALEVMDEMVRAQAQGLGEDDPVKQYMLKAWVRICKCLGPDFVVYLPLVMPPLLEALCAKVEVAVPSDDEDDNYDSDVECVEDSNGGVVAVRSSALQEQATACHMLLLLAEALQEHFLPYVEQVAGQMARLATESVHDDVRTFSMAALPELVRSCGKALAMQAGAGVTDGPVQAPVPLRQLLEFCLGRLVDALQSEADVELVMTAAQAIKLCVEYACVRWDQHSGGMDPPAKPTPATSIRVLNAPQMEVLLQAVLSCLGQSFQRRAVRRAEAQTSEDYDEEDQERDAVAGEEEVELHMNLAQVVGCLAQTHGEAFVPSFASLLLPKLLEMTHAGCLHSDQRLAVYVMDDVMEFGAPAAQGLLGQVVPRLVDCCLRDDHPTRQAASYGLGVCAMTYGAAFAPFCLPSLDGLGKCVARPNARCGGEAEMALDNSVSAIGHIAEFQAEHVPALDVTTLWTRWLGYLPLNADEEEGHRVITQLCRLLYKPACAAPLLGAGCSRLPAVLAVLAQVAATPLASEENNRSIAEVTLALQAGLVPSVPQDVFRIALAAVSLEHRNKLETLVAQFEAIKRDLDMQALAAAKPQGIDPEAQELMFR